MSSDQVENVKGIAGEKTEQAKGSVIEGTHAVQNKAEESKAQSLETIGQARQVAQQRGVEIKGQAGNWFQQVQRSVQHALDTTVNEVKSTLAKVDAEHGA